MSDLLRALPKIKPSNNNNPSQHRPRPMPLTTANEDGGSSSDSSVSTSDSIDTLRPVSEQYNLPSSPWSEFFAQELWLEEEQEQEQIPDPAHRGGNLSASTTAQHSSGGTTGGATLKCVYHVYLTPPADAAKGPLFICHHGAGASGMSFAAFSRAITALLPGAGVCSLEARDHGSSVRRVAATGDGDGESVEDMSIEALVGDALSMIRLTCGRMGWAQLPPAVFVGHSLGGAIATRIAADGSLGAQLVGFAVLDVVEGSAVEALLVMGSYLETRPSSFSSVEAAIEWHVRSRTIRNPESARASVPSLLVRHGDRWMWRTRVLKSQRYWEGWFTGMSGRFLRGKAAKALLLAGTDRLDKELMVGQMQGKFQLTVIPEAGHFIHEDVPEKTAQMMIEFFKRNDRSAMVLPPKVSDLIAQGKKV